MPLKIDIYMAEQCGSYYKVQEVIEQALAGLGIKADVAYHTIYYDDAVSKGIMGSPSIWINGKDAFEGGNSPGVT
jgi:predicted thioredoxin/glutaredoxin